MLRNLKSLRRIMVDNLARQTGSLPLASDRHDAASLASHPDIAAAEALIATRLIGLQDKSPRLTRLKSNHRKWLITHSLFALSSQRTPDDPLSGLTASRLIDTVMKIGAASRNTASAFLQELLTYKFLREIPDVPDRRVRVLETTEISDFGMHTWFMAHMAALDLLDGGTRERTAEAHPGLFRLAHMRATESLVDDPEWRNPPDCVAPFAWSDAGGMILHDLIIRLHRSARFSDGRHMIGPLALSDLAEHYAISVSNVKRMFSRAEKDGTAGWTAPRRRGDFWMAATMVSAYMRWEAVKLAALDAAFRDACRELDVTPLPG